MIQLKGYKVNKMEIENAVKPGTQLKLQNQLKYNVNYMEAESKCVGILEFRITDAQMNPFAVKINMAAEFTYDAEDEKPDIHTGSFDQIFPFVRQIVNNLTALTGMPGLLIPMMKLNRDTVTVGKPEDGAPETSPLN